MNHILILTMHTTLYFKCIVNGFWKITCKLQISYSYITLGGGETIKKKEREEERKKRGEKHKTKTKYITQTSHSYSLYINTEYL